MANVLIVMSDAHAVETLRRLLGKAGHQVVWAQNGAAARRVATRSSVAAVLLSSALSDGPGLALMAELRTRLPRAPVLVLTEDDGMDSTVVAMREGAFDCIGSPLDPRHLLRRLEDALRRTPLQALAVAEVPEDARAPGLVGRSPAMREVFKKLGLLAASRATVLLRGESGTGKEVAARVLHDYGRTGGGAPFVAVHCAALPRALVEAEIFGYRKGAFTGAERDKPGKLELAGAGTLFLDEVGEIPLETQVKLLRVLQERQFERLGDNHARPLEARVIAATHRDLESLVRGGEFREDLYYRLNVASLTIPPLRERRDDIPLIAERLLGEVTREVGRKVQGLSVDALDKLCMAEWPGNVRELRNVLTRAVVRARGRIVDEDDLDLGAGLDARPPAAPSAPERFLTLDELERAHVQRALELAGGHRGQACALLGVSRPTLLRKIRKYGLEVPAEAE